MACLVASIAITATIQETFDDTPLRVLKKETDKPIWISPQGLYGAVDHFLATHTSYTPPLVRVLTSSSFLLDRTPLLLTVPTITPPETPIAIVGAGRILTRVELSPSVQSGVQAAFRDHFDPISDRRLEDAYEAFSTAVVQAAVATFGESTDHTAQPAMVQQTHGALEHFVTHRPHWWKNTLHIQTYHRLKTRIKEAWDMVQLEWNLQVTIITSHRSQQPAAHRKPLYRTIFREK